MAVKAVQELRKKGKKIGYLEFLRAMNTAAAAFKQPGDCVQVAAALWAMLDKQ
jgi:hypothetical protein